ncbi:MAG TPA: hypothetical protein VK021_08615 [Flavobacteriaceae bacterium]|nr:hypothetical protein [Flavobacteriaceae bacterium]
MVNNSSKRTHLLRPLLFLLISIAFLNNAFSQNISKYYTSSTQANGTLYFIEPKEEFQNKQAKQGLVYDLTYLTSKDSISLKFTFTDKESRAIDSIRLQNDQNSITGSTKKLFIDLKRKTWQHRYAADFDFDNLAEFYQQAENPKIIVYYSGKSTTLSIKTRKWKKEAQVLSKIFNLIEQNK